MPSSAAVESKPAASKPRSSSAPRASAKSAAGPTPAPALPAFARPASPQSPARLATLAPRSEGPTSGAPLAPHVREAIQNSLGVDLAPVRVHSDAGAQKKAASLSARAFAFGNHIFLGKGERASDLGLMAHETTHVVQQQSGNTPQKWSSDRGDRYEREADGAAAAVQRGESFTVHERVAGLKVQRLGIRDALDYFADAAYNIPGYRMFTIVLGVNPINMEHVDRSPANILRAVVEFMPGGKQITQALDKYGVFDKAGNWISEQLDSLAITGSAIKNAIMDFLDSLSWRDIFHLGDVWDRAKRIFSEPIDRIKNFLIGLVEGIWKFIRDAILKPLASLAESTAGWDLLIAVLGRNPITGEAVPRTADTLIGGFMKLIHQEEIWQNIKRANAIPRAWAWFQGALTGLVNLVTQIPSLFIQALKSLTWTDILDLPSGFMKIAGVFGKFLGNFLSWAGNTIWDLLQIIFEVVAPGAMPYLKKLGASFKSILKNPIGFVRNLVAAGKLGFEQFVAKIGLHLKTSFIEWLTGSMPGVYIPKSLDLMEIVKFVLSVLGLTWQNIRAKLVKVVGETAVKAMETGFDIVVTLVKEGPVAAWEKIKEELGNLKDMVMQSIMDFIIETVVKKAVAKVASLLVPGGAFIQAIISIYDTIMVFIDKLAKIMQVVKAFLDSMMQIVAGAIGAAANKVETTLAGLLTLAINFLAGFIGLGKIADKVMEIINTKIRGPIDKALDKVVAWIVTMAKKLVSAVTGKKDTKDAKEGGGDVRAQAAAALTSQLTTDHTREQAQALAAQVAEQFRPLGLKSLEIGPEDEDGIATISAEASPKLPLLKLVPKGFIPRGRTVRMVAQFEVAIPIDQAKLGTHIAAADISARTPVGGRIIPAASPPSGGATVSRVISLVTWNTSNQSLRQTGNSSHAEHQFINWLEGKGRPFMSTIEKITVNVSPYSPCSPCSDELCYILKMIKGARQGKPVDATLCWSEAYPGSRNGNQMTTSQNLVELQREGWTLMGGSVPGDESAYRNMVKVTPLRQ